MKIKVLLCIVGLIFFIYSCIYNIQRKHIDSYSSNQEKKSINNSEIKFSLKNILTKLYLDEESAFLISDLGYDIITKSFKNEDKNKQINIIINYPQITGFDDEVLNNNINELIKDAALEPYYKFLNSGDDFIDTKWIVEYTIEYINKNLICIKFQGYIYMIGNANGIDSVYTANIDLKSGNRININELFDESFKNKLNHKYFKGLDLDTSNSDENEINKIFESLKDNFDSSDDNFYFTKDKFVIILPISNFYRFAVDYNDLLDCINEDNLIWKEILN